MHVLVVEDDVVWAGKLGALLAEAGWRVDRVESAEKGLEALGRGPLPALILLDLVLPHMDGWTFYRHLRLNPAWSKIPVMVLTQSVLPDIPLRGILAFLQKQVDMNDTLAEIRQRLDHWKTSPGAAAPSSFRLVVPEDMRQMIRAAPEQVATEIEKSLHNAAQMVAHDLPLSSTWLQAVTAGDQPTLVVRVDGYRVMVRLDPDARRVTVIAVLSPELGWRGLG